MGCKVLNKVCGRGTICQYKVYERDTFFVKNGSYILEGQEVGPPGGDSPYRNLLSTPPEIRCFLKCVPTVIRRSTISEDN